MTAETPSLDYNHHKGKAPLLRGGDLRRAGLYLALALAGFAVACSFWQYLATGRWFNLSLGEFQDNLRTPIGEVFIRPLNIFSHPWMIPVTGLMLGVLIFVPIILSILYRLTIAALFVIVVVVLGHGVVLGMTIALGCVLAARTSLRSDMPFLAALLGLAPVTLYLYLFGMAGVDTAVSQPVQRWILRAPFFIAIVAAVPAFAVVLTLAKVMRYRPGVVWPVLAVLLIVPMTLFYLRVGSDELDYCLIVDSLAPGDAMVETVSLDVWKKSRPDRLAEQNRQELGVQVEHDIRHYRRQLIQRCDDFLARHPRSERAATVLWIKAQAISLQYDQPAFAMDLVKYSADYPLAESEGAWMELSQQHKGSHHGALADGRLGELLLRRAYAPGLTAEDSQALLNQANDRLAAAEQYLSRLPEVTGDRRETGLASGVFYDAQSIPAANYYSAALLSLRCLRWRMSECMVVIDSASAEALSAMLGVNPHRMEYASQLESLLGDPKRNRLKTRMGSNLLLELAKARPDRRERAKTLRSLTEESSAASMEANYELGILLRQDPSLQTAAFKRPEEYFRIVTSRENPWRQQAQEMLDRLATKDK